MEHLSHLPFYQCYNYFYFDLNNKVTYIFFIYNASQPINNFNVTIILNYQVLQMVSKNNLFRIILFYIFIKYDIFIFHYIQI
ncbi:hypothetical protein D6S13_00430 [Salmonella enterica subsp. enterica]|nr:hypothetical protein [Salmonella enterica subsp. enterica]